ncbi:murein DD-endopeptidase MepM/ murein hydrolase activator NlpD [Desulfobotulus alkaliphilus]|uniref:Murein DD-endopeptidase MepM/ murein hydrolase activator NlpD n=1 Tax=Desulfobotulus alkaliphilus TaxID=622671 RepID=A0A562RNQ0_9BACT|nr:peptidoglycan DD-metalloendopeptidase family protein [Desulfobotulus alkaliphilus]TWI70649.1 murein DD-endopeptidase MepM/ murein hydrolase activator NlpD [Desulfobotulus alkaliphilus]
MKYIFASCLLLAGSFLFFQYGSTSDIFFGQTPKTQEMETLTEAVCSEIPMDDPEFDPAAFAKKTAPLEEIHEGTVRAGDTASRILSPWLSSSRIHELAESSRPVFDLRRLRAGREYKIITLDGEFAGFEYSINRSQYLSVELDKEGFHAEVNALSFDIETATVNGIIETSLSEAMQTAEDITLAVRLSNLFGWEIDFARDLRKGDSFSVVVERRYHNDTFQGYGNILAAEIINQGNRYDAFRFENEDGSADFYNSQGQNIQRFFLKNPVPFSRITSGFTHRRWHPILKEYRPHYGVDYAAPTGTPIYAAGSGTILQTGQNAGAGRYVRIRHGNGYETAYLHMSRFARGMRPGRKVSQGDVIGYVGQSGLATGPHVCFRMTKNGVPVDPTKVDSPRASELPEERRQEFTALVASLQPQLGVHYAELKKPEPQSSKTEKKSM